MTGKQPDPVAESTRPCRLPLRRSLRARSLLLAVLVTGCDQFKTHVPPPPSLAEREAIRKARLEKEGPSDSSAATTTDSASPSDIPTDSARPTKASGDEAIKTASERRIVPLTEWTVDETAADALGRIGAAAVPALIDCLQDERPALRRRAAQVLARIGPDALDAVPALTLLLRDKDPDVQREAARALGQIGPAASTAIPDLLHLFHGPTDTPDDPTESPANAP